jgi:hypothetical protein
MTDVLKRVHLWMLLAALVLCASSARRAAAQEPNEGPNAAARNFDEFGAIRGCDLSARLDNLAIQLQNNPTDIGYIICYGPEGEGYGTGSSGLSMMMDYLVNTRGMDAGRVKTIYGGRYKEPKEMWTELWIAGQDAAPPEPLRYNTKLEPFTGKFEEFEASDNSLYGGEGTGPVFYATTRASFAALLHQQPETRAVIVAYNLKGAVPGAWRRAANDVSDDLRNSYKVEAERIEIIYAGYMERREVKGEENQPEGSAVVQLWILPKDAPPPVAVKEGEERPSEAMHLGSFDHITLADEGEAKLAFEGFADVLRSDEQLNACLIVRVEKRAEETAETEETPGTVDAPAEAVPAATPRPSELPKADVMALVGKWRADLVKDYGISEHRLVVTIAEKDDDGDDELETWIVPRGAALPDPHAKREPSNESEETAVEEEMITDEDTQKEF